MPIDDDDYAAWYEPEREPPAWEQLLVGAACCLGVVLGLAIAYGLLWGLLVVLEWLGLAYSGPAPLEIGRPPQASGDP